MPQRKPTKNGWKNRVSAPIKGLTCSWQWCCTPCARKQVHCCAKQCKVVPHILHILHIIHICFILQLELTMETKSTTRWWTITGQAILCPTEQTVGTNVRPLQIPMALPSQALFQAFVLTYGTEQRFDASSHTIWREEAVTTWDTMLCDGKWFRMAMQVKWASMQCFQSFRIKLPVFCMNTMIHRTPLWPCLQFPWTGVMSVFTASSDQIRYYEYEKQNVLCA
jgi:hypothetical protein